MNGDSGKPRVVSKTLSRNDLGLTGSHQAGMLVPRELANFFPPLRETEKNPRAVVEAIDEDGVSWNFNFIHYNNKLFGGTRHEYRLTRMTKFLRMQNLVEGDLVEFKINPETSRYSVSTVRGTDPLERRSRRKEYKGGGRIVIIGDWEVQS